MKPFDVVVLGADLEALVAAATLAQGGRRVALVASAPVAGGAAVREEFHPGYRTQGALFQAGGLRRELLAPLGLERYGLGWRADAESWLVVGDGATLRWHRDARETARRLARDEPQESATLERWHAFHERIAALLNEVLDDAPPALAAPDPGELLRLAKRGWRLRRLAEADFHTLLRALTLPVADWAYQWFANPLLRTAAAATALPGSRLGPRAAGTAALCLLRTAAMGPEPEGGAASVVDALVACAEALGVSFLLGDEPRSILVDETGVRGLRSALHELDCPAVLSCLGPARTRALFDPRHAPHDLVHAAERWRSRGAVGLLHVALDHVPAFGNEADVERVLIARNVDHLERTADALKYRRLPEEPWLELWLQPSAQTNREPSAPQGHAVLSVRVHGVPYDLEGGWTQEARALLEERVWRGIERALPGLRTRSLGERLLVPPDLEQTMGVPGGHLEHGELALDQLWIQRPSLGLARYASELPGLFLGGGSQHPGGPFLGGAGTLAARAVLNAPRR